MSELEVSNIDQLTTEILIYKQQTAQNIIEIGKRLIAVKEKLPHGEWGKWLEEKVDFKKSTANNFMRVASEFSNLQALGTLSQTKVFALLDLPQEERETFIAEKNVEGMTTRELQQVIREKKELKEKLEKTEEEALKALQRNLELRRENEKLKTENHEPTVIEKEVIKEVTSQEDKQKISAYESEIKRLAQEKREALERLKEIESGNNIDELRKKKERLELEKHVSIFDLQIKIQNFLKEASPGVFLQGAIAASDRQQKQDIIESLKSLKAFIRTMEEMVQAEYEILEG